MKAQHPFYKLIAVISGIGLFLAVITGCSKSSNSTTSGTGNPSVLTTLTVTNISTTTATSGGNISSDGGSAVTARGVCWSKVQNPTIADSKTSDGTGSGSFTSTMQGLTAATPYFVRAYATNSVGTSYGDEITFTSASVSNTVTDFDGNIYHIVTIGTQQWLVENLKVTHYRNGDTIAHGRGMKSTLGQGATGMFWNYNNSDSLGHIYGHLYNYFAITDPRFIAPLGWHVPSDADWTVLADFLAPDSLVGGKLKETGYIHWNSPNTGATNSSGFTALPGGAYNAVTGVFSFLGYGASLWASTPDVNSYAWARSLLNSSSYLNRGTIPQFTGASVRCIKGD